MTKLIFGLDVRGKSLYQLEVGNLSLLTRALSTLLPSLMLGFLGVFVYLHPSILVSFRRSNTYFAEKLRFFFLT